MSKLELTEKVKQLSEKYFEEVKEIRRHLHKYPELSFEEISTAQYITQKLHDWNIPFQEGIAKTGIIATIKGEKQGKKHIALRADMDALPVQEMNKVAYASVNKGIMHACGHDVHVSALLGVAKILKELQSEFAGTFTLIFQPGEEKLPGGAKLMIQDPIFKNNPPDLVIAQHVLPTLEKGKLGFKAGKYMASCDELYVTIKGKGGHGAMPHQITDTILIASHIIVALQQIVSRQANASIPTVLSFGRFIADGATNVIPSEVKIEGTFRTMNEHWRKEAHKSMKKMACSIAQGMGAECEFNIMEGYPALINDTESSMKAMQYASELLGPDNVVETEIRMTAEDFSYFTQNYKAFLYRLGVKGDEVLSPLHSSTFNIDEEALKTGISGMAWLALSFINEY
jgi:amidohydrolase